MKIKPLLKEVNQKTFLYDLLSAYKIKDIKAYLNPTSDLFESPWDYPNMDKGVELLHEAIEHNYFIGVLVDSDCDGFMSSGIMANFLSTISNTPLPIFHTDKAHGLSNDVYDYIKGLNLDLLIIPDASSNDGTRCTELTTLGTKILVLDHHEITEDNTDAIVINHHLLPTLNQALSGTGVTYKFIEAYCEKYNINCPNYMDMVAVSLVSDICDLSNIENRTYLDFGLNIDHPEEDGKKFISNPLLELMFHELAKDSTTPKDVAWSVSPKINAIFRAGNQESKEIFFKALIGQGDIEAGLDVAKKAHGLQTRTVKKIVDELEPTLDVSHNVIITYIDIENRNYSGLIANKIAGKYHKPTLVLRERNEATWSGSVRSPVKVASLINETKLAKCQGHEEAFGIMIKKAKVDELISWFDTQKLDDSVPITAVLTPKQATVRLARQCASNSHLWGHGLDAPVFYITGSFHGSDVNIYQKKTNTIKFNIEGIDFLKFRATDEEVELFSQNKLMDIEMIVSLSINEWRGKVSVQGLIENYEIALHKSRMIGSESWENLF